MNRDIVWAAPIGAAVCLAGTKIASNLIKRCARKSGYQYGYSDFMTEYEPGIIDLEKDLKGGCKNVPCSADQ